MVTLLQTISMSLSCNGSPKPKPTATHHKDININGKDPSGNYWITGMLSQVAWKEIEKQFEST